MGPNGEQRLIHVPGVVVYLHFSLNINGNSTAAASHDTRPNSQSRFCLQNLQEDFPKFISHPVPGHPRDRLETWRCRTVTRRVVRRSQIRGRPPTLLPINTDIPLWPRGRRGDGFEVLQ